MHKISVVQLGVGGVGSPLLRQYLSLPADVRDRMPVVALADTSAIIADESGLSGDALLEALEAKKARRRLSSLAGAVDTSALPALLASLAGRGIVVDATAADATAPILAAAVQAGCGVVLANKRPLAASMDQWRTMHRGSLRYEATVGAGLPVLGTLAYLQATGDHILRIEGALSGTLGFLFSRIEAGDAFSAALRKAFEQRYTEPDPRDDLGGMDVARKALILARTIGMDVELSDIAIEPLYPSAMNALSVADFLERSAELDTAYAERRAQAARSGDVLRYLATVAPDAVSIGLRAVPAGSDFGSLRGADNLISIATERYASPMRIAGPGAGTEVTAAAVLADTIDLAVHMRAAAVASSC
ncbi:MAG: homoserine dehydrogenase [Anaerolineae bacterium]